MKLISKRYIDGYAPGAEVVKGRYDEATLRGLLTKGHVVIVEDEEPATGAAETDPEKARAAAEKRREEAVKAFALRAGEEPALAGPAPAQALVIERIPEAESDTVTRVYAPAAEADAKPGAKPAKPARSEKPATE